jgi:elongation factor Ts
LQVSTETIKELREKTGAGVIDCKKALEESCGDMDKACVLLNERGTAIAQKKASRTANLGLIETYIHAGGRIGAMVEINCETDFAAQTDQFKDLAHNIAMQVAAMCPQFVSKDEITDGTDIDPQTACLLSQTYIKDPSKSIQDIITETVAKVGENIKVRRFVRFELGC